MAITKKIKDQLIRLLNGKDGVPRGLFEMDKYFRLYGPIRFEDKHKGDRIVAVSVNFNQGTIITSGDNKEDLDNNIKDAILTAFEIPSSYASEARVHKLDDKQGEYAIA